MTTLACPCGADHSGSPGYAAVANLVFSLGEMIEVVVADCFADVRFRVPRIYIAMHGLRGSELVALAEQYGWRRTR
jgi:hypothetical protein